MLSPYTHMVSTKGSAIRVMDTLAGEMAKEHGADKIFNFSLGNPRVPPPEIYKQTLIELANEDIPMCHGYTSTAGDEPSRTVMAELFSGIQDVKITKECVVMCSGCAGAINVALKIILSPGDNVIFTSPYFLEYPYYVENWHANYTVVPTTFEEQWQINPARLEEAVTPLTRAVIINSPHNPTGTVLTQETVDHMCEVLERKSKEYGRPIYIISDDVYCRVVAPGVKAHQIFKKYAYSVVCYSLSKDLSIAGERIGCLIINPLLQDHELFTHCAAHANEIMGFVHANRLQMRMIPRVVPATADITIYNRTRDMLCELFDELGIPYVKPQGGFYIFPKIPEGIDDLEFCQVMARNFIILVPGSAFGMPGFFRLSFCKTIDDIERAIPVFRTAFAEAMKLKK